MKLSEEEAYRFAGFLKHQAGPTGRANLAELRRAALDPEHDFRDVRILAKVLADDNRVFDAQRLTAGLFALYAGKFWGKDNELELPGFSGKIKRKRYSLGFSLGLLRDSLRDKRDQYRAKPNAPQESLDLRFIALLDTAHEDLVVPLRGLLQRLAAASTPIPVDFAQLLLDLVSWEYDIPNHRSVRRDWARDYWQPVVTTAEPALTDLTDSL